MVLQDIPGDGVWFAASQARHDGLHITIHDAGLSVTGYCTFVKTGGSLGFNYHEGGRIIFIEVGEVTAIELFAGAGGIALGLEKAGIHTLEYVEFDKACCETLKANRPNWNVICDDIHNVSFKKYNGKIDIVTGGFPCQAFSYAGKKMGFADTRGTLFHEFARCVKEVKPKIFMAENVRGLISHDQGRTLATIIQVLENLEYDVQYKVLNAAYYGVGQKRERIVIIGIKKGTGLHFNYPIADKKMTTLKTALKHCPESKGQQYSKNKKAVLDLVPPGGCWVNLPEDIAKKYMGKSYYSGGGKRGMARRIAWNEPCLTLTCSPSQKQTERCHPDETRPFTVREYARIQSFPDDWEFFGGIGDKYKQIGNAVPVELARRLGIELKRAILKEPYDNLKNLVFSCYWCNNAKTDTFSSEEFKIIGKEIGKIWKKRLTE